MGVSCTHGAGLDVHKTSVMACRLLPDPPGTQADGRLEVRACGTLTIELLALSDGLAEAGITQVAMERTAAYGKPVFNPPEGHFPGCSVSAAPGTRVPGRKTGKAEARWRAERPHDGLWQARCIPPQGQRDLRELTRDRTTRG